MLDGIWIEESGPVSFGKILSLVSDQFFRKCLQTMSRITLSSPSFEYQQRRQKLFSWWIFHTLQLFKIQVISLVHHLHPCRALWLQGKGEQGWSVLSLTNRKCGSYCQVTGSGHLIFQTAFLIEIRKETAGPKNWETNIISVCSTLCLPGSSFYM